MKLKKGLILVLFNALLLSLVGCSEVLYPGMADVGNPVCVLDESYDANTVTAIVASYSMNSNCIVLKESYDGKIHLREFINSNRDTSEASRAVIQNGELTVTGIESNFQSFSNKTDYLEIMLPADFLGCLTLQTASGSVTVDQLNQANLTVTTISGTVLLDNVSGKMNCQTTSGAICISNGNYYGNFSTTSGRIDLKVDALDGDICVSTSSGSIAVTVSQYTNFDYQIASVSGRVWSDFDKPSGSVNGGGHKITLSSTSGSIQLKQD